VSNKLEEGEPATIEDWEGEPATAADWNASGDKKRPDGILERTADNLSKLPSGLEALAGRIANEAGKKPEELGDHRIANKLRSALLGFTYNWAPDMVSRIDAAGDAIGGEDYDKALRARKEENRGLYAKALEDAPAEYVGGMALSPNPLSKVSLPAKLGLIGRVGTGAIQGAGISTLAAAGASKKEGIDALLDGAKDAPTGAILGGTTALGSELIKKGVSTRKDAAADAEANVVKAADKRLLSEENRGNAYKADLKRLVDHVDDIVSNPQKYDAETVDLARSYASSPDFAQVRNTVARNAIVDAPRKVARFNNQNDIIEAADALTSPEAITAGTKEALSPADMLDAVMKRAKTYGTRAIPAAVAAKVGDEFGPGGGLAGTLAGSGVGAAMGAPGTALANLLNRPSFRYWVTGPGEQAVGGPLLGVGATGQAVFNEGQAQSLTSDEEKRRRLEEKFKSLLGD
jgi:hypothetical protein